MSILSRTSFASDDNDKQADRDQDDFIQLKTMDGHTASDPRETRLVGTTGQLHSNSSDPTQLCERKATTSLVSARLETTQSIQPTSPDFSTTPKSSIFIKNLEWSADGTTLLTTTSADSYTLDSFVLPPTLLQSPPPHILKPYTAHSLPEPTYATAVYPFYHLAEPSTCLFLASLRNLPTRLYSSLGGGVLGSYPLISPTTEAYIAPHSLHFSSSRPNLFFAGSNGMVALFDISRPGQDPIEVMRTGRKQRVRSGTSMINDAEEGLRGIVSTMATSCDGHLAAGTFSRNVGLYDDYGHGEMNAIFSVNHDNDNNEDTKGTGITQVLWDETGRYLCVGERGSDGISVWDIRGTGQRLAWLRGRKAKTPQRMGVAVMNGEVWAGGTDGVVRVWERLGMREGALDCDWQFVAHGDAVNSIGLHPGGTVLATCAGQRHYPEYDEREEADGRDDSRSSNVHGRESLSSVTADSVSPVLEQQSFDNSLKVWALSDLDDEELV